MARASDLAEALGDAEDAAYQRDLTRPPMLPERTAGEPRTTVVTACKRMPARPRRVGFGRPGNGTGPLPIWGKHYRRAGNARMCGYHLK